MQMKATGRMGTRSGTALVSERAIGGDLEMKRAATWVRRSAGEASADKELQSGFDVG
jgi:hypothetical protein